MLRLVDDYLVITTSRAGAEALAAALQRGFPDYNCFTNPEKTRANFPIPLSDGRVLPTSLWCGGDGSAFIRWCGLLINSTTLELQADYTRYSGQHIATSLTLPLAQRPGRALPAKLAGYLRPKCHALLLDTAINSHATVRLNIYQSFLLAAMKMTAYLRAMAAGGGPATPRLVLRAIQSSINYMVSMVRSRPALARARLGLDCTCAVSRCHIRWLGLTAFAKVLNRKQGCYQAVLAALAAELRRPTYRQLAVQLGGVVDDRASSVFDEIIY